MAGTRVESTVSLGGGGGGTCRRPIPDKVIIGYATDCNERVAQAVREGVNVVVWAFLGIRKNETDGTMEEEDDSTSDDAVILETNSLNLDGIRQMIADLDDEGYDDTVHLVAFGGWNGGHLDSNLSANVWYAKWKEFVGDIFHGIDWDPEGHDDLEHISNSFTLECLDKIGTISQLAKRDGYIVTMAPAQSYLDPETSRFSRHVNCTDPYRPWHSEFHYFGPNAYAYLLANYGESIDLIAIQFYESFSRAAMAVEHYGIPPESYLEHYVQTLAQNDFRFYVDFEQDKSINLKSQTVSLPLSKLVWGFANGWANGGKHVFFEPSKIQLAYSRLQMASQPPLGSLTPRGFMFWVIGEEGTRGVHFAKGLNDILGIRKEPNKSTEIKTNRKESNEDDSTTSVSRH
jgi:chitinase